MKNKFLLVLLAFHFTPVWGSTFYADPALQDLYPQSFATQASAVPFLEKLAVGGASERAALVSAIEKNPTLYRKILNFSQLILSEKVETLRELFLVECAALNIQPPELTIDETSIPGYAYFDFDLQTGGAGKVFLNLKKMRESKNPEEFVMLLLHETRHSAQLQSLDQFYWNAFRAQQEIKAKKLPISFCDFMLLLNEFEAFQFGNYVYGSLVGWSKSINDMGTLASQYDQNGKLRLDLLDLHLYHPENVVSAFNQLEVEQYEIVGD